MDPSDECSSDEAAYTTSQPCNTLIASLIARSARNGAFDDQSGNAFRRVRSAAHSERSGAHVYAVGILWSGI